MDFERHKTPIKEISLIPLINVVFLLLIFFLVAGTVEKFDIVQVELPEAMSGQVLDEGHISIILGQHDEILINEELVRFVDVKAVLMEQLSLNKERIITVKADSRLSADRMIAIMDVVKEAGGRNLSLVTQTM